MDQELSNENEKDIVKAKRKSTRAADNQSSVNDRLANLEACVAKMATLSGNANHLAEFGLKRWDPSKKDMQKYK